MNEDNGEEPGVFENIDCSDAFNTSWVFATREDVLQWVHTVAYDIGFVAMIIRSDTYRKERKNLICFNWFRKCGCPFKQGAKPVLGGEEWMMKLICETHNHALDKSFVGHPYVG
ncbi:hypothetical protein GmHk_04G009939 [Glycine max]|nr:hypothetical protein GmHk_04G009939 [Glycine max]